MRCKAKTKQDHACKNMAMEGAAICFVHKSYRNESQLGLTIVGAIVGNAITLGIGGIIAGAAVGDLANRMYRRTNMKKKVFVSFDFDNDKKLKDFIIGQSKLNDSPFEVIDHSLKEAAPEHNWESKANAAIKRSDIVIVMVGPNTHRAQGVLKEVNMARTANKHIVQVIGYKEGDYTAVPGAGRLYKWNWDNLKKLLA
jgi:hypothetical protein